MDPEDDVFNCIICMMAYNDPRILPCGHSFCFKCLLDIAKTQTSLTCPLCKKTLDLRFKKERKLKELPKNYCLGNVMDAKEKASSSACSEHNKLLDIFCGQCDLIICSKCLSSLHAGHVTKDTDKVFAERKENLAQFLATIKLWFAKFKEKEESIKASRLSIQKDADSARGIIADLFENWYDALRAQERVMISYVAQQTEKRMKACEEAEKVLQQSLTNLTDAETEINTLLSNEKTNIIQEYGSVKARHEDIGKRVVQDVENCCKLPEGFKIVVQAPWMDEAIVNIKSIDTATTEAISGTQKVSDIIEENSSLKSLKTKFEKYQKETIALKSGHQDEIKKLKEEIKALNENLKTKSEKYQKETIALKSGHQNEIQKLKIEIKELKESLNTKFEKYQNETIALKSGHQKEIEKCKEENKALKERLKRELEEYEKEKLGLKCRYEEEIRGLNEEIKGHNEKKLRDGSEFNERQIFISTSNNHLLDSLCDPLDLDTTYIYLNVTKLQNSCRRLHYLSREIQRKKKSKDRKEKKKGSLLGDSKDFKQKKEAYRELFREILVQKIEVDSLFDASKCPPNNNEDDQKGCCTESTLLDSLEIQRPNLRPCFPQLDKEQCEKCLEKTTLIWKLEANIDKTGSDVRDLQHIIDELEVQIEMERSEKEVALRRLSSIADKYPKIAEMNDPNTPTKIAELLFEIYHNEWTHAFHHLEKYYSSEEGDNLQLLLNILIEVHQQCNNQSENILSNIAAPLKPTDIPPEVSKNLKDAVKMLAQYKMPAVAKDIKNNLLRRFSDAAHLFRHSGDVFDIYVDKCIDACLHMSVQDPPMYLSVVPNKDGLFSHALYGAYKKSGKYELFIVWPVLYLHKNGPMMAKGVAQGTNDNTTIKNNSKQNYQQPAKSSKKSV